MENYTVEQMISLSWVMLKEEWQERGPTKHFLHEFLEEFSLVQQLQIKDVLIVLAIAVLFTIHRFFTTIFFIKVCFFKLYSRGCDIPKKMFQITILESLFFKKKLLDIAR